jgi:hypothetical protein
MEKGRFRTIELFFVLVRVRVCEVFSRDTGVWLVAEH